MSSGACRPSVHPPEALSSITERALCDAGRRQGFGRWRSPYPQWREQTLSRATVYPHECCVIVHPLIFAAEVSGPIDSAQCGRTACPSSHYVQAQGLYMPSHGFSAQVFGEEVRGVVLPRDLVDSEATCSHLVLYPEVLDTDMSQFAQTLPVHDAQGCARICVNTAIQRHAEIFGHGDDA